MNSRIADKFVVRLPEGLRSRIANVAHSNHRSMNSEIVARLEFSLDNEPVTAE
ncbi:Arc family DNA-binding protein, partial [Streptococcus pyogenes]